MKKGSDLLVSALENEGVDRIFGVPGEENLDVVESLRTSKIKLILPRHEQAAAFMAATHGRLTGKPGVCISTLGPGALNFSTGAPTQYTAYHVAVPFSVSSFIAAIIGGLGNPLGAFIG
jgi:acetolactate synthase I/II/III large subunit